MYPENQYQPPQQNNYDFIMKSGGSKRPNLLSGGGSGKQLLLITGGVIIFIILLFSVGSMLTHKDTSAVSRLTKIAQEQTEIAHISNLASNGSATAQSTKNFAQTAQLTMTSDQQNMLDFLAKNGINIKASQLTLLQDPKVDQDLQNASDASNFDAVFRTTASNMLANYQSSLKQAYSLSKSNTEKQLLSDSFNNAELLKKQLSQKEF